MRRKILAATVVLSVLLAAQASAKVDLVTLPARESVQLTIYNSADLTLVRDRRPLTLKKGMNELQFSWAGTLIDPTSLHLEIQKYSDQIDVVELAYPSRVKDVGVWRIKSETSGKVPVEITYFTSGLTWESFYLSTLTQDGGAMTLKGYVRVTNKSGEDYENARTRLVVGKINLLDQIAELGRREHPYGSPAERMEADRARRDKYLKAEDQLERAAAMGMGGAAAPARPKEIAKEAVSEYFLYTIEGTETIKDGWSKRLPSFEAQSVNIESWFRYDTERYGEQVVRLLRFKNDEQHNLGETPLPGGLVKVFRREDTEGHLSFLGSDQAEYIPVGQKVELNLGQARTVKVEPKVMKYAKDNLVFNPEGNINGFDEVKDNRIEVNNYGQTPATIEVFQHFPSQYWSLSNTQNPGEYTKVDENSVKYMLDMEGGSEKNIEYTLTLYHGQRQYTH